MASKTVIRPIANIASQKIVFGEAKEKNHLETSGSRVFSFCFRILLTPVKGSIRKDNQTIFLLCSSVFRDVELPVKS